MKKTRRLHLVLLAIPLPIIAWKDSFKTDQKNTEELQGLAS
jgi:hypothetical protein